MSLFNSTKFSHLLLKNYQNLLIKNCEFHTSNVLANKPNKNSLGPKNWLAFNKLVFPPQINEDEPPRPGVNT